MLAGWAANNKYSLLGGLRSAAQMVSYEMSLGLAVVGVFLLTGSFKLSEIVAFQWANPFHWNILLQPLGFFLFVTSIFAETNRLPFDLPEGESEIVAGYHVEYLSMKFALFFMAEYAHIVVGSCIIVTLFLGGWHFPFLTRDWIWNHTTMLIHLFWIVLAILSVAGGTWLVWQYKPHKYNDLRDYETLVFGVPGIIVGGSLLMTWLLFHTVVPLEIPTPDWVRQAMVTALQLGTFVGKVLFVCFVFIWVRWTLPRFRYDQVMRLGWKMMLPLALVNVMVTAVLIVAFQSGPVKP